MNNFRFSTLVENSMKPVCYISDILFSIFSLIESWWDKIGHYQNCWPGHFCCSRYWKTYGRVSAQRPTLPMFTT